MLGFLFDVSVGFSDYIAWNDWMNGQEFGRKLSGPNGSTILYAQNEWGKPRKTRIARGMWCLPGIDLEQYRSSSLV